MPSKKAQLLARVNFPMYTVAALSNRHVLVAGGGGGAKTGIRNVIEIYELINDGASCQACSVVHFETGNEAIMNCAIYDAGRFCILFSGKEGNCQVYKIQHEIIEEIDKKIEEKGTVQKRNKSKENENVEPDNEANLVHSKYTFKITTLDTFQTDFSDDPFQKLVKFSSITNLLATAGTDGHLRLWKYPKLNMTADIEAHSDDVDDLDICSRGEKIITVSRDGHAKVWDAEKGSLITELQYSLPSKCNMKYVFRACKFGRVQNKDAAIFATLIPAVRKRPSPKCYVCKWDSIKYTVEKIVSSGTDVLTVMAISDNGNFIGLGTQDGSVKICIAFNLQIIYQADHAHGFFVTGLQFLPTCDETRRISGGHEASLISISVDNHVNIHHIPFRDAIGILSLSAFLIITLFVIFVVMDFLNL